MLPAPTSLGKGSLGLGLQRSWIVTGPMVEKPKAVILILTKPKPHSGGSFEPAGNEVATVGRAGGGGGKIIFGAARPRPLLVTGEGAGAETFFLRSEIPAVFPDDVDDVVFGEITSTTSGPPCLRLRDDPWKKERREDVNCC